MKKAKKKTSEASNRDYDLLPDYDMSGGVRGKYAARFATSSQVVVLEADLAKKFPSSEKVNAALRELLRLRRKGRSE